MKIELKSFTGKENFTLRQRRMKYALAQQGLNVVFVGENKLETMTLEEWETLDGLARGAIGKYITVKVMLNVMEDIAKKTWEKLEQMCL